MEGIGCVVDVCGCCQMKPPNVRTNGQDGLSGILQSQQLPGPRSRDDVGLADLLQGPLLLMRQCI